MNTPVPELMLAPLGAPGSNDHVSVWAGLFVSVAMAWKLNGVPSTAVLFGIGVITGGVLLGANTIVKTFVRGLSSITEGQPSRKLYAVARMIWYVPVVAGSWLG